MTMQGIDKQEIINRGTECVGRIDIQPCKSFETYRKKISHDWREAQSFSQHFIPHYHIANEI